MAVKSGGGTLYGICVRHDDGTVGWLTGASAEVLAYRTPEEAQRALRQKKRDAHYSWNCEVLVDEIPANLRPTQEMNGGLR